MLFDGRHDSNEVIERFLSVLSTDPADDPHRLIDAGSFVAFALGGELSYYTPLDGDPRPGTVLAEKQAAGATVSSSQWIDLVRTRLHDIVDVGVEAVFLVRGLVHHVRDSYRALSDTGSADATRARSREGMLALVEDPVRLQAYQKRLIELDPQAEKKSLMRSRRAYVVWRTSCSRRRRRKPPIIGLCFTLGNATPRTFLNCSAIQVLDHGADGI